MAKDLDPYQTLEVPLTADAKMLDAAFKRRIFVAHPDHGGTDAEAAQVLRAAKILRDPAARAKYDRDRLAATLEAPRSESGARATSGSSDGTVASASTGRPFDTRSGPSKFVTFLRYRLVGQWIMVVAVFMSLALIVPTLDHSAPGTIADSTVANLTLAWLLVGAALSRSWTRNPLAQTLRFSWRVLVWTLDTVVEARR